MWYHWCQYYWLITLEGWGLWAQHCEWCLWLECFNCQNDIQVCVLWLNKSILSVLFSNKRNAYVSFGRLYTFWWHLILFHSCQKVVCFGRTILLKIASCCHWNHVLKQHSESSLYKTTAVLLLLLFQILWTLWSLYHMVWCCMAQGPQLFAGVALIHTTCGCVCHVSQTQEEENSRHRGVTITQSGLHWIIHYSCN